MKKKTVAYILIGVGVLAAVIYYFATKNKGTVATDSGSGAAVDPRGALAAADDTTYAQMNNIIPQQDRLWVQDLAQQAYTGGMMDPANLVAGKVTKTGALAQAYFTSAPNANGKYTYKWGNQPNVKNLWPKSQTDAMWNLWAAFRTKYNTL